MTDLALPRVPTFGVSRRLLVRLGWAALVTVNVIFLVATLAGFFVSDVNADWTLSYRQAAERVFSGGLYDWTTSNLAYGVEGGTDYLYRYSPAFAYFVALVVPLGVVGWTVLHFAPLLVLPRKVAALALLSAPFWNDVYNGNVQVFVFVAAFAALTGSRIGTVAFFALALMIPKPLMLPVLVWLLWKRPETRWWFAGIFAVHAVVVLASGYGPEWVMTFLRAGDDFASRGDLGPANFIGLLWVPIGLGLAALFTWKGRLGLASICASPYWLLPYLLMPLLDVRSPRIEVRVGDVAHPVDDAHRGRGAGVPRA